MLTAPNHLGFLWSSILFIAFIFIYSIISFHFSKEYFYIQALMWKRKPLRMIVEKLIFIFQSIEYIFGLLSIRFFSICYRRRSTIYFVQVLYSRCWLLFLAFSVPVCVCATFVSATSFMFICCWQSTCALSKFFLEEMNFIQRFVRK